MKTPQVTTPPAPPPAPHPRITDLADLEMRLSAIRDAFERAVKDGGPTTLLPRLYHHLERASADLRNLRATRTALRASETDVAEIATWVEYEPFGAPTYQLAAWDHDGDLLQLVTNDQPCIPEWLHTIEIEVRAAALSASSRRTYVLERTARAA